MGIEWEDCKLSIFEDMTRESAMMRKQFTAAWKLPWDHKVGSSNFTVVLSGTEKSKVLLVMQQHKIYKGTYSNTKEVISRSKN